MDRAHISTALAAALVLAAGCTLRAAATPDCCKGPKAPAAGTHATQAVKARPSPPAAGVPYTASHAPGVVVRHIPSSQASRPAAPASIAILPGGTRPSAVPVLPQAQSRVMPESVITPSGAVMAYAPAEAVAYATATVGPSGHVVVRCDDRAAPPGAGPADKPPAPGKATGAKPAAPRAALVKK